MLSLKQFFGLSVDENISDILPVLQTLGIDKLILTSKVVKSLTKKNGRDAAIVSVAMRQQALKCLHPLLNENMLKFESNFYSKEINTSSEHDRRYSSEEHLLEFALQVASTKNKKMMLSDPGILTIKQLRDAAFLESRFDRCWEILSQETHHTVSAFRKSNK